MNRVRQHARAGGIAVFVACLGAAGSVWADSTAETQPGNEARDGLAGPTASLTVSTDSGVDRVTVNADSGDARETAAGSTATSAEVSDAWSQQDGSGVSYGAEDPLANISLLSLAAKLGLGLGVVVLLAWGVVFVLRKSSLGRQLGSMGSAIRVIERTYLGPKKAVFLVQVGDRTLALGVTDANISALSEWNEGELTITAADNAPSTFANQLKSMLGKREIGDTEVAR